MTQKLLIARREREREREREPRRTGTERTQTPPPNNQPHTPPPSTTQSIQFTIGKVEQTYPGVDYFRIEPNPSLTVNGTRITQIILVGDQSNTHFKNGDFAVGNTILITNARFSQQEASIDNGNELFLGNCFDNLQVITQSATPTSPSAPDNPPYFPEVRQKNHQLAEEENNLALLATELLKTIEENKKICQEAHQQGLNLPEIPVAVLDYFQEEFFTQLDENQHPDSFHNRHINTLNERIRQKKLNIKNNLDRIHNNNKEKLSNNNSSPLPKNDELAKLKKQTIDKINKILAEPDNLRNIDLTTLANGQYQNWENDIEGLTSSDEVAAYENNFLTILKEAKTKGKNEEEQEKNQIPPLKILPYSPKNNIIDNNIKKIISSLPLSAAKNFAKNKIRDLFKKYQPNLEKLKEVWKGENNWMSYLEKCNSSEEIVAFLEKIERAIIQQSQNQESVKNKPFLPKMFWTSVFLIISLLFLVSLVIIIIKNYNDKKKKY